VHQINLADGKIVGGAPIGIEATHLFPLEGAHPFAFDGSFLHRNALCARSARWINLTYHTSFRATPHGGAMQPISHGSPRTFPQGLRRGKPGGARPRWTSQTLSLRPLNPFHPRRLLAGEN